MPRQPYRIATGGSTGGVSHTPLTLGIVTTPGTWYHE